MHPRAAIKGCARSRITRTHVSKLVATYHEHNHHSRQENNHSHQENNRTVRHVT